MFLPECYDFDPDADLTLVLYDDDKADTVIANHLKEVVSASAAQIRRRAGRSTSGKVRPFSATGTSELIKTPSQLTATDGSITQKVYLGVSSKHLTLASPVFKALLRGGFAEARDFQPGGNAEVTLPEDNPAALWLLLHVLHGQPNKVPSRIDLEMLTKIAVLVDKYELHEAAAMVTTLWFSKLDIEPSPLYEGFVDKILQVICISWVLRESRIFSAMTRLAMLYSDYDLNAEGIVDLPIPKEILGKLP